VRRIAAVGAHQDTWAAMRVTLTTTIPDLNPVTRMRAQHQPPVLNRARCACGGEVYLTQRMFRQRFVLCAECGAAFSDADMKPLMAAFDRDGKRRYGG